MAAAWSDDAISDWLELEAAREEENTAEESEDKEEVALATPGRPECDEEDIFQGGCRESRRSSLRLV